MGSASVASAAMDISEEPVAAGFDEQKTDARLDHNEDNENENGRPVVGFSVAAGPNLKIAKHRFGGDEGRCPRNPAKAKFDSFHDVPTEDHLLGRGL